VDETYAPDSRELEMADTDAEGHTTLPVAIDKAPDVTQPVKAQIDVEVDDPAGRASRTSVSIPVRPAGSSIGIKPLFPDDAVDAQTEAAFDIAAVSPNGSRIAMAAKLRLVRNDRIGEWSCTARSPATRRFGRMSRSRQATSRCRTLCHCILPNGSISDVTGSRWRKPAGWPSLRIASAPVGRRPTVPMCLIGSMSLLTGSRCRSDNRCASTSPRRLPARRRCSCCPTRCWRHAICPCRRVGPQSMYRSRRVGGWRLRRRPCFSCGAGARPGRALGLTWVGVDPTARMLPVNITIPDKTLPRGRLLVPVKAEAGAWLTMAVVDEGILRLTRFVSPDPAAHYLARRRLGLDIRDDWGRLIAPGDGAATSLKQGGDDDGTPLPDIPIRTVTLFTPPVQAGADGTATIPIEIPDFNGQVRLMVVAWHGNQIGAAASDLIVRDPLIAEALLPRFLAPGDDARLASCCTMSICLPARRRLSSPPKDR